MSRPYIPKPRLNARYKRAVYLTERLYRESQKAAQQNPVYRENWSLYVETALREKLARDQEER